MKAINLENYNHYLIDTDGNVYSTKSPKGSNWKSGIKKIKSFPNKTTGYHQIILQNGIKGLKPKIFYVHRLVALTYIPNPFDKKEVNHIIPDRNNNSVRNLEWVSREENKLHQKHFGTQIKSKGYFLLKKTKLIDKGIKHFNKHNDINYLCNLWGCSVHLVRNILKKFNVQRINKIYSPYEIQKIKECINNWGYKNLYSPKFKKYVEDKTNIKISYYFIRKIKENKI